MIIESGVVGLDYWMKWQVLICALVIAIPAAVSINLIRKRGKMNSSYYSCSYDDLWVPCWRNLNPRWLLAFRALAFLSMAWLLYQMFLFAGFFAFYFYTQWSFALVMVYFAIGTIISAQGCLMSSDKSQNEISENDDSLKNGNLRAKSKNLQDMDQNVTQSPGTLGSLMQVIYQTSAGASLVTDLVFWCVLVPMLAGKQFEVTFVIGAVHSVNAVFLVIDSALNKIPFEWFGFTYFILWSVTYTTFHWILRASGITTWWPYPFLELATPWAPLWYLGLAVAHVPCYGTYSLLVIAKNSMFARLFPRAFVRSYWWRTNRSTTKKQPDDKEEMGSSNGRESERAKTATNLY